MKTHVYKSTFAGTSLILILCTLFQSCISTNRILVQDDLVYATKRLELRYLCKNTNRRSPLLYVEQTVSKEIKANNEISYKIYDVVVMPSTSFNLKDEVFLIIDQEVYPLTIDKMELENAKSFTENKEEILRSDSTKVTIVTGYSENNRKITRFSYSLTTEMISKIKEAHKVQFQYYAGPSMLNVKMKMTDLNKFKRLIDKV